MEKTHCTLSLSCCRGGKALLGIQGKAPSLLAEARQGESPAWGNVCGGGRLPKFPAAFPFCSSLHFIPLALVFGQENRCWLYIQQTQYVHSPDHCFSLRAMFDFSLEACFSHLIFSLRS